MKKIVIASACRTAIGKFGGTLANVPAVELGSIVIKEALNRANVAPEQVDHVYMGCVIQAGLGQNVARQAALKAGLPIETPAVTVNVVCGSGLNCVNMAAQMIEAGDADIVVAGGMENMDMAPFALQKARYGYRMGAPMGKSEIVDTMVNDALWDACGFNKHMGMTAENVCTNETYQKKYGYSLMLRCRPKAFPQKAFLALLIGIGVLGLIPPLLWQAADTGLSPLDGSILSALIYIGVGASVVSFLAWSLAIERIGMVRAGIIYNSIPLFASLEATLFLGESITLPQMIGGVLIIGGICYASFGDLYAARRLLK